MSDVCPVTVVVDRTKHYPHNWKEVGYESRKDAIEDTKDIDGQILVCCLYEPHDGFKHMNPRIMRTCGGMMLTIPGWSAGIEKADQ